MKKLPWILGALAMLPVLAFAGLMAVGAMQPVEHTAASQASYAQAPDAVWARLVDFPAWTRWNAAFDRVVREDDRGGKPCWRFEGGFGPMPMIVEASAAPALLVTRIPADAELGFSGTWTYELARLEPDGTRLTVTETGRVESALLRGVGALFRGPHDTLNAFLVDLGRSFGEETLPREIDG